MTTNEYKAHYTALLKAKIMEGGKDYQAITLSDVDAHVGRAIQAGLEDFWEAYPWPFREYDKTLTVTGSEYELPSDVDGVANVRDQGGRGTSLEYLPKEEFDMEFPRLDVVSAGAPRFYTLYFSSGRVILQTYPRCAGRSLIVRLVKKPLSVEDVPASCQKCLDSYIAKSVFPHGHRSRIEAINEAELELRKAIVRVRPRRGQKIKRIEKTIVKQNPYHWI